MKRQLCEVIHSISNEYGNLIVKDGRNYIEVDIAERAEAMGYPEIKSRYGHVNAVVPIKHPVRGMKVRIDGRTFSNYKQVDSGVAIPGHVVKDTGLSNSAYIPVDSMILNFA
jgi:hypothetical protein